MLHAYRQLGLEGLVTGRRGVGTFVAASAAPLPPDELARLRASLERWVDAARAAGPDGEDVVALFAEAVRPPSGSRAA